MSETQANHGPTDHPQQQVAAGREPTTERFTIVGVGASAGGLEALEAFFEAMPTDTGMAFVVIQHLSPEFKSHMAQLLGRHTAMPIHRIENGMLVHPNTVYLIPPKMEMVISRRRLLLTEKGEDRTLSHPIDQFFASLAKDVGEHACGVILSGTGSDGSLGIKEIHQAGGLVLVQDEQSAKFDGMPLNARATGVADLVLSPPALAQALVRYAASESDAKTFGAENTLPSTSEGIERIFELLNQQHGIDFSNYKSNTVGRRIQRRVDLLRLRSLDEYLNHLETDPSELNQLYKDLLIGVTNFFRDPDAYTALQKHAISRIADSSKPGQAIRVWVAGCATGEEAYSIAILFDEEFRKRDLSNELKIFATDAHHVSLNAAARGIFPDETLSEMTPERRARYFRKHRDGYHVTRELRKYIVFAPHNLISDAPFTQMDLVTCRNLLIYLRSAAQEKALSLIHFALKPNAALFLGPSETPGALSDEFDALDKRWKIYRKARDIRLPITSSLPLGSAANKLPRSSLVRPRSERDEGESSLLSTYDMLLERKMPPSILIDQQASVLHVFGDAQRYLRPRIGRPSQSLLEQVVQPLKQLLSGAIHHVLRKKESVHYSGIRLGGELEGETIALAVEPLIDPARGNIKLLVEFRPKAFSSSDSDQAPQADCAVDAMQDERISTLESELQFSQENLQATVEEMETSNEELQATNEELVASNEELQSTNEELHSVNEELYSVNAEHQRRLEELTRANDDMDNLLATTRVGVIFLDEDLTIRRFTPEIARLFDLAPQDIGRSIEGFAYHLKHGTLLDDLKQVLASRSGKEVEVSDRRNTPYLLRILPYRSGDEVDGVVMTLIDIYHLKEAEADLKRFQYMTESARDAISLVNREGDFVYVNPAMCAMLGYGQRSLLNKRIFDVEEEYTFDDFLKTFETADDSDVAPVESNWIHCDGRVIPVEISVNCVVLERERLLCTNVRNVSERRRIEHEMQLQHLAIESAQNGIIIVDATANDFPITYANPGFYSLTGYTSDEVLGRNCRFLQGPDTDSNATAKIREALANSRPCSVTLLNYRRDGSQFWNDLYLTPVFDEQGRLQNYVGVQHDITQRIESEATARRHAQRTQAILDSTAEGIYGIDRDGVCTFCNRAAVTLLGYSSEEELIGKQMHALIHHSYANGEPIPYEECPIYKTSKEYLDSHVDDQVFWRKDGSHFHVEYWSRPKMRDGELLGAVVTFQDITEQLAITSRLEKMGLMLDASYDAIIVWKVGGEIVSWNTGATQLYGYSASEAIGCQPHDLFQTRHSESREDVMECLLNTGQWSGRLDQVTREGQWITVSTRHQLLTLPDGEQQVLEINRDITEHMRVHKKLEQAKRVALRANEAKTAFLANISHELRTPITAMLGFADILNLEATDAQQSEKIHTIKRNGEYLLALLNDILDLSKIEAGKIEVESHSINVVDLVNDIRSLVSVRSAEEGIPLHFQMASDLPESITADTTRVRQILINLISNGLKFTDEGSVSVVVKLVESEVPDKPASLDFSVHDTGIGMTEEQQRQLFKPFSQATPETAKKYGGTGLGLSISKRLAEQMGGSILVSSQYRKGSSFTLRLPVSPAQLENRVTSQNLPAREPQKKREQSGLPQLHARVLLADDRRDVWRVGRYFLEKCGASVTIAEDGRQAIDAAIRARDTGEPFELILMDMQMPVMDGREAVRELRDLGFGIPIIALTAHAMEGEREACLELGCTDYFSKPIDGARLMNLVSDLLEQGHTPESMSDQ